MAIISQKILARALQKLQEESWPLDKVVIQKVIYYLKTQGLPIEWHFEAYTYGPFSFSLSSELTSMTYCERLDEDNNRYTIKDLNKLELEVELRSEERRVGKECRL